MLALRARLGVTAESRFRDCMTVSYLTLNLHKVSIWIRNQQKLLKTDDLRPFERGVCLGLARLTESERLRPWTVIL